MDISTLIAASSLTSTLIGALKSALSKQKNKATEKGKTDLSL